MDAKLAFITLIMEMVMKYGVPAALAIISQWKLDHEPTLEEILELKGRVQHPSVVLPPPV